MGLDKTYASEAEGMTYTSFVTILIMTSINNLLHISNFLDRVYGASFSKSYFGGSSIYI